MFTTLKTQACSVFEVQVPYPLFPLETKPEHPKCWLQAHSAIQVVLFVEFASEWQSCWLLTGAIAANGSFGAEWKPRACVPGRLCAFLRGETSLNICSFSCNLGEIRIFLNQFNLSRFMPPNTCSCFVIYVLKAFLTWK